ncbi:hypothetical protein TPHA_0K02020 [Tetrapisispora phaffii CBS 4417]|uniref:CHCH domain-containing protein n=1 Tax=Tetrapisispora phaffii (strain ATCC 24235 / CBS 4417 / NBRC 1672 / NRRL Y-8282 / UCD 70-5) TaxID=1071381 RepID=G8BZK7_TETPH|nr:hypothetical protein TPHA_0K02020 [Tetrapisispora phaffii CBS 4417]CCE65335.1 hypothetical protein TPHA_0K02020 [Tetrapisispora phaffii CBS 4417]
MSGNPGGSTFRLSPTPPERGSFPLDHDGECTNEMIAYMNCIKLVKGENGAVNCRIKARDYLKCRMDHGLMERDDFKHLGLPEPRGAAAAAAATTSDGDGTGATKNAPPTGKKFGEP